MVKVAVEQILMGSFDGNATGENVTFDSPSTFDDFFNPAP